MFHDCQIFEWDVCSSREGEALFRMMNLGQFGDGFQPSFVCLSGQFFKQEGRGDGQEILEIGRESSVRVCWTVGLSFAYMSPIYYEGCLTTVD
jgi:hypothetical protein